MKKLTNVLALEMVLGMAEVQANTELVAKLETMKAQFEKKNSSKSGEKKPTKTQQENEVLKGYIMEVLTLNKTPMTIAQIQAEDIELKDLTNQKMSALLKQLVDTDQVVKTKDKKALANKEVNVDELNDISKARIVYQCDVKNGVSEIKNYIYDDDLQASVPTMMVQGADNGIKSTFVLTQDAFTTTGDVNLINHKTYYYMAISYAYNNYQDYK